MLQPGQLVRVNLAGLETEGVTFQAAVTDAVGHIVQQTSEEPPKYLVKLLFSLRGVTEVEVPATPSTQANDSFDSSTFSLERVLCAPRFPRL